MTGRYAYLIMVDAYDNHNKFYEIIENDDLSLDCNYGRIDKTTKHKHYDRHEKSYYDVYYEKTGKGYKDVTDLYKTVINEDKEKELSYTPVEDEVVQKALERMIEASRMFMQANYKIEARKISDAMISKAKKCIDSLSDSAKQDNLFRFNYYLEELFTTIPRQMTKVGDYLAKNKDDYGTIINRENQMLQNLISAVKLNISAPLSTDGKAMTVLEARGLTMRQVTFKEEDEIISHLGKDYNDNFVERRFVRAFAVENTSTRANYEKYKKDHKISSKEVKLFYHGSKLENWYSILSSGLLLNPDAIGTGKMFGQGLYFAPECRKALNYMDVTGSHWNSGTYTTGYTAIYSVALGKPYEPQKVLGKEFKGENLPKGYGCVYASKHNPALNLKNDEYIVYSQDACTIKYIMEIKHQFIKDLDYTINRKPFRNAFIGHTDSMKKRKDGKLEATINVADMTHDARKQICSYFHGKNIKTLNVAFAPDDERFQELTITDIVNDDRFDSSNYILTEDDLKFLFREFKKNYADGNYGWSELMKKAKAMRVGGKIKPLYEVCNPDTPTDKVA